MNKKILALLLAVVLVVGLVPVAAMAADECDHWAHSADWDAVSNGNNTHNNICVCGETMSTVDCVEGCTCGGYVACDHWAHSADWDAVSNGNNTHNNICVCGETMSTVDCVEGCTCGGYVACDHWAHTDEWKAVSNGNNTHNNVCVCGETVNTVDCVEGCTCGGYVACDHWALTAEWTYTDNSDGTHKSICKCGVVVNPAAAHGYNEAGLCVCGAKEVKCGHVGAQDVIDNKDGATHKVVCPLCGEIITEKAAHVYAEDTGLCACGAAAPQADLPQGETDNVPKTGDMIALVLAGMMGVGTVGTGLTLISLKKKN